MLIPEVQTVAGEMLGRAAKAGVGMSAVHVSLCHLCHPVHIVSVGAYADDRVLPVVQDIADRGKGQVAADGGGFLIGHIAQVVGVLHVAGGSDFGLAADGGAVHAGAVSSVLRIAGDDQGNPAVLLEDAVLLMHLVRCGGVVADAADVVLVHGHFQVFFVPAGAHVEEELSYLLVQRHIRDCIFYPFTILIGQVKGVRFHINHTAVLSFLSCTSICIRKSFSRFGMKQTEQPDFLACL